MEAKLGPDMKNCSPPRPDSWRGGRGEGGKNQFVCVDSANYVATSLGSDIFANTYAVPAPAIAPDK